MRTLGHHCQDTLVARRKREDPIVLTSNVFTSNLLARHALGACAFPSSTHVWVALPAAIPGGYRSKFFLPLL